MCLKSYARYSLYGEVIRHVLHGKKCVVLQELYHLEISLSYHIGNVKKQMPIESISKKQKIVSKCRLLMLHDSCTIGDYDLNTEGMAWLCLSYFLISDGFLDFLRTSHTT